MPVRGGSGGGATRAVLARARARVDREGCRHIFMLVLFLIDNNLGTRCKSGLGGSAAGLRGVRGTAWVATPATLALARGPGRAGCGHGAMDGATALRAAACDAWMWVYKPGGARLYVVRKRGKIDC